jgi:MarR family 2-MHQ and catechol resistance regulon transcriptional repressor
MNYQENTHIKFMIVMNKMRGSVHDRLAKQWKDLDINETEFLVLFALDANGPLTIQDIGLKINMTSGTMTYVIDKLEKKDYIKRVRCSEDRRRIYIELTEEGKSFWDETIAVHTNHLKEFFGHIEEEEMLLLIKLMKKVGKA